MTLDITEDIFSETCLTFMNSQNSMLDSMKPNPNLFPAVTIHRLNPAVSVLTIE